MLPPETERIWQFLRDQPFLRGFVLIGGTALALRLAHRISEDLDLIHPGPRLPRGSLALLTSEAERQGFH
ncbi:MAG: nucleotidyl transferase AbiEii/AbiGii toxin family protein, partial [Verrucomicrobiae bacterium]|nr:nucleotidyl transferase AbiEii/AbiGii toxin family protein [Verrucomicrobiae bacterium]